MSNINTEAALESLAAARYEAAHSMEQQQELCSYAGKVLAERGSFVFATSVMFGGVPGLIGSADSGTRLSRATEPIPIGETHLALRDPIKSPGGIELLQGPKTAQEVLQASDEEVIATFSMPIAIGGVKDPGEQHIDAIHTLIMAIEAANEPIPEMPRKWRDLPGIAREFEGFEPGKVYTVRERPEELFAGAGRRLIQTNFSQPDFEEVPAMLDHMARASSPR